MLKKKEAYNAELYRKFDIIPVESEITVQQAVLFVRS